MAMALFGLAVVVGPAVGPTLGGYIVDNYSWPWIFYINLPVGVLALFMVTRFVHEPEDIRRANLEAAQPPARQHRLDRHRVDGGRAGRACSTCWKRAAATTGSTRAPSRCARSSRSFVLAAFVIRELTAPFPAVDLRCSRTARSCRAR